MKSVFQGLQTLNRLPDAIFLLESRGLKVSFKGKGRVKYQNIPPGKLTKNFNSININLG